MLRRHFERVPPAAGRSGRQVCSDDIPGGHTLADTANGPTCSLTQAMPLAIDVPGFQYVSACQFLFFFMSFSAHIMSSFHIRASRHPTCIFVLGSSPVTFLLDMASFTYSRTMYIRMYTGTQARPLTALPHSFRSRVHLAYLARAPVFPLISHLGCFHASFVLARNRQT